MYKHILIATDGSELAKKAETHGLALARDLKAAATAVTVTEAWSALELASQAERGAAHPIQDYEKNIAALAERILSTVSATAKGMGVACVTLHTKDRHPAEGIIQTAKARGCDLIVMASHGRRGDRRYFSGARPTRCCPIARSRSSSTDKRLRLLGADRCLGSK